MLILLGKNGLVPVISDLLIRICLVYYMTGFWVYPFMKFFSPFTFALFIVVSAIISGVFYYIGKGLCWLRHGVNSI